MTGLEAIHTWKLQFRVIRNAIYHKHMGFATIKHMFPECGARKMFVSAETIQRKTVFSITPSDVSYVLERRGGLVCGVGCYLASYFTATTYMSGQRPGRQLNTLHLQESLHRVKKTKKTKTRTSTNSSAD